VRARILPAVPAAPVPPLGQAHLERIAAEMVCASALHHGGGAVVPSFDNSRSSFRSEAISPSRSGYGWARLPDTWAWAWAADVGVCVVSFRTRHILVCRNTSTCWYVTQYHNTHVTAGRAVVHCCSRGRQPV
jgi:hypothetical protein